MAQTTASTSWRSRPSTVLPLAFLQSLAFGFIEIPSMYLFRELECEKYKATLPEPLPEGDLCRSPPVQKAYSVNIALWLAIATVCSIAVSGPYGRISDLKGRRIVMSSAASMNALGDLWLCLAAFLPPIRSPYSLFLSAFLKGLGGSFSVVQSAHAAFIADTSSSTSRSFYLGLALVMFWIASAIAPLGVSFLLVKDRYSACYGLATACWVVYFLYSSLILKETRTPSEKQTSEGEETSQQKSEGFKSALVQSLIEPLSFIFRDTTLRWLGLATFTMLVALGAFSVLVVYCDYMFGMHASEAGIIASVTSVARAFSVLVVLPIFLALYRRFYANKKYKLNKNTTPHDSSETSHLLSEEEHTDDTQPHSSDTHAPSAQAQIASQTASAAQELLITRICFLIDALGMILISFSRGSTGIMISTTIGSMGAPAAPSLQALVTLAASPSEVGRVLAGFSILESTGVAIRNPILFGIYGATLEVAPRMIWYFTAGLFVFCAFCVMFLRPTRFIRKPTENTADNHE